MTEPASRGTLVIDVEKCKGCELCIAACPPKVLVMSSEVNETGYRYLGKSSAADHSGDVLHWAPEFEESVFTFEVDPAAARQKRVVTCAGEFEIDRVNWRRPEMYGPLVEGNSFTGHSNK